MSPPPEHSHTVHCDPSDHGPVSGCGAALWVKGFQEVVVKRYYGPGGDTSGFNDGNRIGGGGGHIKD